MAQSSFEPGTSRSRVLRSAVAPWLGSCVGIQVFRITLVFRIPLKHIKVSIKKAHCITMPLSPVFWSDPISCTHAPEQYIQLVCTSICGQPISDEVASFYYTAHSTFSLSPSLMSTSPFHFIFVPSFPVLSSVIGEDIISVDEKAKCSQRENGFQICQKSW